MKTRDVHRLKEDEGSSLLEFCLMSLVFIIILLSVVEMGRMVLVYTTMANSAREGVRYAICHGSDRSGSGINGPSGPGNVAQVQTVVQYFAGAGLLTTSNVTIAVTYPDGTNTPGSRVNVRVTYVYDPLVTYFNNLLNDSLGSTSQGVISY